MTGGNDYNCGSTEGFFNSSDGGATFRHHCVPVVGAGGCGDPNVAYDTLGNSYILGIGNCNGFSGSIVLSKSSDNGVSWSPPVALVTARPTTTGTCPPRMTLMRERRPTSCPCTITAWLMTMLCRCSRRRRPRRPPR